MADNIGYRKTVTQLNNNHKCHNPPADKKPQQLQHTTVPTGTPTLKSKIEPKVTTFLWEINGIANISKLNLWRVLNCQFDVGQYKWKISLEVGAGKNILYAKPELIHPINASASYSLRLFVVNPQNYVLHASQFGPDHPLFYDNKCKDSGKEHGSTWEVLRFSDGIRDLFSNYVFNDTLKILIEMTVYVNVQ